MKKNLSYVDSVHRDGTIWNLSMMGLMFLYPIIIAVIYQVLPDWQALAMGLRSGMQLEEAMELAAALLEDRPRAAARCGACRELLLRGEELAASMERSGLLTKSESRLLALGRRGGRGDEVMEQLADRKLKDARDALETAVSRVEPALILVTSGLVGAILLSVMLPLMDIMTAIG